MNFVKNVASYAESAIENEVVLMNVETGRFHALSGVALAIWRLPDSEAQSAAIKAIVAERYEVDAPICDVEVDISSMRWSRPASWSRARQAGG